MKLNFISSIWDDDHIQRFDENNWQCLWCYKKFQGMNATKALAQVLGKMACILIDGMQSRKNRTEQHIESFSISELLGRLLFSIVLKISNILFQVYRISHLQSLDPPYTAVLKVSLHQTTPTYMKFHVSALHHI